MKTLFPLKSSKFWLVLAVIIPAACTLPLKKSVTIHNNRTQFTLFSKSVKDSFYISVQLPLEYNEKQQKHYPVAVVTDANFFFPMLSPVLHQYEKGGLLPPMILVGIGYNSFTAMNALRVRDYLYPKAIPSDEMQAPGGGQHFYHFITTELIPVIDARYRTQANNRVLLGHSFGAYFSLYAFSEQLNTHRNDFKGFIAASPSLWYHNNYLFQIPQQLKSAALKNPVTLCLSVGSLEDTKWSVKPVKNLSGQLSTSPHNKLKAITIIYPDLDHMDVGLISFVKGLEVIFNNSDH